MNRDRSRVRVNIHTPGDKKKCGGMTMSGVTLFHVEGRSIAEENIGLFSKGRITLVWKTNFFLEFSGSWSARPKGVLLRR